MAHKEQIEFVERVKRMFPDDFKQSHVLDVGSYDINGNNRRFFEYGAYVGIDITPGPNVDLVCPVEKYPAHWPFDVVICTEMLEHDVDWVRSLKAMWNLVKPGGLLIITCATTGRTEHGTFKHNPQDSKATLNYYRNVTPDMLRLGLADCPFEASDIEINEEHHDLYFWGRKEL